MRRLAIALGLALLAPPFLPQSVRAEETRPEARFPVAVIAVEGNARVPTDRILATLGLHEGQTVTAQELRTALQRVADMGTFQSVVPMAEPAQLGGLRLVIRVHEMPVLGTLRLRGNTRTAERVIRRELTLQPGDMVTRPRLEGDIQRLMRLGYFESVTPEATAGAKPDTVDLTLVIQERNTGRVSASGGWNAIEGPLAAFSLANDNFMGEGRSLSAQLTLSRLADPVNRNLLGEVSALEPWLDSARTSLGASAYMRRFYNPFVRLADGTTGFQEQRGGLTVTLGRPLFGDPVATPWRGTAGIKAEQAAIAQLDAKGQRHDLPGETLSGTGRDWGLSGTLSLSYDTRDAAVNPSSGLQGRLSLEQYVPLGDLRHTRLDASLSHYWSMSPTLTLALGARLGTTLTPLGGRVPTYQDTFSYGEFLLRGWKDGEWSGEHAALLMAEARMKVWGPLQLVAFGDTGAYMGGAEAHGGLHSGYGLGIRIDSPLGLLRADYGLHAWGEGGALSIGVGHRF